MLRVAWTLVVGIVLLPFGAAAAVLPAGFDLQPVVLGPFNANPVGFAFLPDGRILVLEKNTGGVRLATPDSTASELIFTVPDVPFSYESGLLGVAVDPDWPARPFIYVHASQNGNVVQVIRYTGLGELENAHSTDLQLIDPFVVLADLPDQQGIHQGGTLRFGSDGYLYISIGDDGSECLAQDRTRLNGKILRIDVASLPSEGMSPPPKTAIVPPTNPYTGGDENEALVYAYGFRNPFRFSIDPLTNELFVGDVGQNTYEEVSQVPYTAPGGNFGWPEFEGTLQDPVAGSDTCATGPFTVPFYSYAHSPTGQASVICGPIVRPAEGTGFNFPNEYHGNLFVAEFFEGWIKRFVQVENSWEIAAPVPGQADSENWVTDLPFLSDLQIGPDGGLYVMVHVSALIERGLYRIVWTASTDIASAPRGGVRAYPNPLRPGAALTIQFDREVEAAGILRVFDLAGRLVHEAACRGGKARWDGSTRGGRPAAAGIYVYRVESPAGGLRAAGKVALVPR